LAQLFLQLVFFPAELFYALQQSGALLVECFQGFSVLVHALAELLQLAAVFGILEGVAEELAFVLQPVAVFVL